MTFSDPARVRRLLEARAAESALARHRRRCRTCRAAPRQQHGLCTTGRQLLYALQAAAQLAQTG